MLLKKFDKHVPTFIPYCIGIYKKVSKPPKAPVDVKTSCDLVTWRRPPNTSLDEIVGYHVRFVSSAMHTDEEAEVIIHTNATATFYRLSELNDFVQKDMASVQVSNV